MAKYGYSNGVYGPQGMGSYGGQPSGNFFGRFNVPGYYRPPVPALTAEQINQRNAPTEFPTVNEEQIYGGTGPAPEVDLSQYNTEEYMSNVTPIKRAGVRSRNLERLKDVKRRPMSKQDMSSVALRQNGGNDG